MGFGVRIAWSDGVLVSFLLEKPSAAVRRLSMESPVSEVSGEELLGEELASSSRRDPRFSGDHAYRGAPPPEPVTLPSSLLVGLPLLKRAPAMVVAGKIGGSRWGKEERECWGMVMVGVEFEKRKKELWKWERVEGRKGREEGRTQRGRGREEETGSDWLPYFFLVACARGQREKGAFLAAVT